MPRRNIPKIKHTVTAIEREERVDEATGEIRRVLDIYEPDVDEAGPLKGRPKKGTTRTRVTHRRNRKLTKAFAYVDVESMAMLDLTRQEHRVFMFLMSKIDQGTNEIRVTNTYIAKSIGMTQNNVSRTMKSLRERLIVLPVAYGVWKINSWIAWTGEYGRWYGETVEDPEPYWDAADLEAEKNGPALSVVE